MKSWPTEIKKLFEKLESMKEVNFDIFDKQTNQVVFSSGKGKKKAKHLPGLKIIEVRFSL